MKKEKEKKFSCQAHQKKTGCGSVIIFLMIWIHLLFSMRIRIKVLLQCGTSFEKLRCDFLNSRYPHHYQKMSSHK